MTKDRFTLDKRQIRRFERFQKDCEAVKEIYEEGVAPMSPFLWTFRPGSIADEIIVYCHGIEGASVDLSLDDDGQWVKPYRKP